MRLDSATLFAITGRKRPTAQVAWFRQYLNVAVPCDKRGPIMTATTYDALLARALGLAQRPVAGAEVDRPRVRLRRS